MKLPIKKAKVWNQGNSAVITIPNYLIESGKVEIGKEYDFEVDLDD